MTLHNCYYFGGHCCHCIQGSITGESNIEMFIKNITWFYCTNTILKQVQENRINIVYPKRLYENTFESSNTIVYNFNCSFIKFWLQEVDILPILTLYTSILHKFMNLYYLSSKRWFSILQPLSATSGECICFCINSNTFRYIPFDNRIFLK